MSVFVESSKPIFISIFKYFNVMYIADVCSWFVGLLMLPTLTTQFIMLNIFKGLLQFWRLFKFSNIMDLFYMFFLFFIISGLWNVITVLTYYCCIVLFSHVGIQSILEKKYIFTLVAIEFTLSISCMFF